ncbi:MAG: hypothetical protein R3B70_37870 [Polyangiaceae bacterium]
MGAKRLIWHVGFERNLLRRGPRSIEIRSEVPLSDEPLRLDYLLVRKRVGEGEIADDSAETLRRLWPMLPKVSVVELKSPGRGYRSGNLQRLWGYVHLYFAAQRDLPRKRADGSTVLPGSPGAPDVLAHEELCAVLVVPHQTPSLLKDIQEMRLRCEDLGGGYVRADGGSFVLYVVEIDVVAPTEGDDLLYFLGSGKTLSPEARLFWMELVGSKEAAMSMQDMEGYKELMEKLLDTLPAEQVLSHYAPEQVLSHYAPEQVLSHYAPEQVLSHYAPEERLAGLPPEQRLAGLPPEQRLAGLDRDHQALALPVEVLRMLPEEYLRSLSPEVEAEIRRRLRQNGH